MSILVVLCCLSVSVNQCPLIDCLSIFCGEFDYIVWCADPIPIWVRIVDMCDCFVLRLNWWNKHWWNKYPHCNYNGQNCCLHAFSTALPDLELMMLLRYRSYKLSDSVEFAQFLRNVLCFLICPELSTVVFFMVLYSPLGGHGLNRAECPIRTKST